MITGCPGSQKFKKPQPENIKCHYCGEEVEIWTDEAEAKCTKCGRTISREKGQSCLDWCKYAKACVGDEIYERFMKAGSKAEKEERS